MAQSKYRVGRISKDCLLVNRENGFYEAELSMMGMVKSRSFDKLTGLKKWVVVNTRHKDGQIPLRCVAGKDILDTAQVVRRVSVAGQEGFA